MLYREPRRADEPPRTGLLMSLRLEWRGELNQGNVIPAWGFAAGRCKHRAFPDPRRFRRRQVVMTPGNRSSTRRMPDKGREAATGACGTHGPAWRFGTAHHVNARPTTCRRRRTTTSDGSAMGLWAPSRTSVYDHVVLASGLDVRSPRRGVLPPRREHALSRGLICPALRTGGAWGETFRLATDSLIALANHFAGPGCRAASGAPLGGRRHSR